MSDKSPQHSEQVVMDAYPHKQTNCHRTPIIQSFETETASVSSSASDNLQLWEDRRPLPLVILHLLYFLYMLFVVLLNNLKRVDKTLVTILNQIDTTANI